MSGPILVVDDDIGIRTTMTRILEDAGHLVYSATDGLDALAALDGLFPALILLDLAMPRMDGWAFVAELERLELRSKIPVVVLTADGRAQGKAEQLHAEGYLPKPFNVEHLLEIVARRIRPSTEPG
ncbi:MAG TPA: response regulator [Dehalococcoidia bacterium]|nr:response regulator [Dehalococcoidia bacterium]